MKILKQCDNVQINQHIFFVKLMFVGVMSFGQIPKIMFVRAKNFRSNSNQFLVILIRSSEPASYWRSLYFKFYLLYNIRQFWALCWNNRQFQKNCIKIGRDENVSLETSTVDRQPLMFSTGWRRPDWGFLLVHVDHENISLVWTTAT